MKEFPVIITKISETKPCLEGLKTNVRKHVLGILTTYMETRLNFLSSQKLLAVMFFQKNSTMHVLAANILMGISIV